MQTINSHSDSTGEMKGFFDFPGILIHTANKVQHLAIEYEQSKKERYKIKALSLLNACSMFYYANFGKMFFEGESSIVGYQNLFESCVKRAAIRRWNRCREVHLTSMG